MTLSKQLMENQIVFILKHENKLLDYFVEGSDLNSKLINL